jgi:hypothetical protein
MGKSALQKAKTAQQKAANALQSAAKAADQAVQKTAPVVKPEITPIQGAVVKTESPTETPRVETSEASEGATAPLQLSEGDKPQDPSNPPTETGVTVPPEVIPPVVTTNPQTTEPPTPSSAQAPAAVVEVAAGYVTDLSAFDGVPTYVLPEPPNVR